MPESGRSLERGANLAITFPEIDASIEWKPRYPATVYACLIGKSGKLASKSDIVASANPGSRGGAVSLSQIGAGKARYKIDLAAMPADVDKVLFCVVTEGSGVDTGDLGLGIHLGSHDEPIARFDLPDDQHAEVAALVGELYRRNDSWKFRAKGDGFEGGLEPLAKHLQCSVQDLREAGSPAAPASAGAVPRPPPAPGPAPAQASPPAAPAPDGPRPAAAAHKPAPPPPAGDRADQFSCRGWTLSEAGVVPAGGPAPRGAAAMERELLDLRADPQGGLWPAAFAHQPMTGEQLLAPPRFVRTVGRAQAVSGLPHLEFVRALDPASRREESVPEAANAFAAGGSPARLVAVDMLGGRAWWKAPWSGKWVQIGRCPTAALPQYAMGLAGTEEGLFYGASEGLVQILADQQPACRLEPVSGAPVGPPAVVGDAVILPFRDGQGLAMMLHVVNGETKTVRVKADDGWREEEVLGAPVTNGETAFWVGSKGFLSFEYGPEGETAVWKRWPARTEGVPFLRPFRAVNGRFYAMCREVVADQATPGRALVCAMGIAGSREKHELLGPHVSVGPQTYRGRDRYPQPWEDPEETVNLGLDYEGRWLLPLVRLGSGLTMVALVKDSARDSGSSRQFIFREGAMPPREAALALHADNGPLTLLGHSLKISSTDDFEIFMDANRLCIHHPESNKCVSWSISF